MWGQPGGPLQPVLGVSPAQTAMALMGPGGQPGMGGGAVAALPSLRREPLSQPEAAALLAAARGPVRHAAALALMGLALPEMLALTARDIDLREAILRVGGAHARVLPLPDWLGPALLDGAARHAGDASASLLADAAGQPLAEADLQAQLACAAVDAGLPAGATLDAAALRDTCIAWLVSQGLRLSDLSALVGRIEVADVAALAARASDRPRIGPDQVERLMPALTLPPQA
jgi:integrase